jgi:hypothetical protein
LGVQTVRRYSSGRIGYRAIYVQIGVITPRRTTALRTQESPPAVGELARDNRARVM